MSKNTTKDWAKIKEDSETPEVVEESSAEVHQEAALDHPSYLVLEEKLTIAEQQAHENWEKAIRATAELDNVQRRAERDIANAHRFGMEKMITSLIPVIDSLDQALQSADKEQNKTMIEGIELTMKLFLDVLTKFDVKQINPEGLPFDPQQHEAMSIQEVADVAPNTVLVVFQKGYILNERVIRPARVIVSKNTTA
jgi:molecular chaperone GrpE